MQEEMAILIGAHLILSRFMKGKKQRSPQEMKTSTLVRIHITIMH